MSGYKNIVNKHRLANFLLTVSIFINALIFSGYTSTKGSQKLLAVKSEWAISTSLKKRKRLLLFRKRLNTTLIFFIDHLSALFEFNRLVNIQYACLSKLANVNLHLNKFIPSQLFYDYFFYVIRGS